MGKFQAGQPKPRSSGRRKGTKNNKSLFLEERLREIGFDVPAAVINLLPELSADKRADVLIDLMSFLFPKRKAVENFVQSAPAISCVAAPHESAEPEMEIARLNRTQGALLKLDDPGLAEAFEQVAQHYEGLARSSGEAAT